MYTFVCKKAKTSGTSYSFDGVTNIITVSSFPCEFGHEVVTCWKLDEYTHVQRVEMQVPLSYGVKSYPIEADIRPAAQDSSRLVADFYLIENEFQDIVIEQNCSVIVRVFLDDHLVTAFPVYVRRVRKSPQQGAPDVSPSRF